MYLYKLEDFDPDYQDTFGGDDIQGFDVYSSTNDEKIGSVKNILVDEEGHFRYLVVDTGFWVFGKQVLLPIGRSRIEYDARRVYAEGLTKEQAEELPEFNNSLRVDYDYEEQVRGVYRNSTLNSPVQTSAPMESFAADATPSPVAVPMTGVMSQQPTVMPEQPTVMPEQPTSDRDTYTYKQEPFLYEMNDRDHQTFKLYQERLVANKKRVKTGEVAVGKHVETETARVSVPIEKERVVIERVTPADAGTVVNPGAATFREGEVAQMEIYEETPDIHKEAFVREEVRVKKEVNTETVTAREELRREELDVKTENVSGINTPNT